MQVQKRQPSASRAILNSPYPLKNLRHDPRVGPKASSISPKLFGQGDLEGLLYCQQIQELITNASREAQ